MQENIVIRGAREHNLKNVNVTLPRNKITVITGLSGSGKSTLAFDTIYAEGQRRYVESLSAYARQFLGLMSKPDVDSIDGLSPAISIEQKTTSKNPRSTVGTVTEIYDYLRLLFARIGTPYCPTHNTPITSKTPDTVTDEIIRDFSGKTVMVLAPVVRQKKGTYDDLLSEFRRDGYTKARVNKDIFATDESITLERYKKHDIDVVIDRLAADPGDRERMQDDVEAALKKGEGLLIVLDDKNEKLYSQKMSCPECDVTFEELQPRMFSFNSPFGACEECHGLGIQQEIDPELVIPDKSKSVAEGAIAAYCNMLDGWRTQQIAAVARAYGFSMIEPVSKLTERQLDALLYGSDRDLHFRYESRSSDLAFESNRLWEGVIPQLQRLYKQTESEYRREEIEKFMVASPCPKCGGRRLKDKVLSVKIAGKSIIDVTDMTVKDAITLFRDLKLTEKQQTIARQIVKEINSRLLFLDDVGLSYISMSRAAGTLSGGEAQRIRLATQIGSNLTGVLYVLDEPSIGLHQRDNHKLIETLMRLRDIGNTLIVVEHDENTIMNADHVVDMGPGAGIHGGRVVAEGTALQIMENPKSLTGKYLSGKMSIGVPKRRRKPAGYLEIKGCAENNLKSIDVGIPMRTLTCITGVSGSGKSTLIHEILYKGLMRQLHSSRERPGKHDSLTVPPEADKVIMIDQSPIGKTPRSNPATYIGVFDEIRRVFAMTPESRARGYLPGRYSFNVRGGRCEACHGDGMIKIEMNFLPDVYVQCEECKGKRYNRETLEVTYKGKTIAQTLDMSVEDALAFFENIPRIRRKLQTLCDVGLGYIKLGQSSTTLSGGEAQRIKLTRELSKRATGNTIYLLDEPTTGLHFHDVDKLLQVLFRLVDKGNSVVIIEHNLDVVKSCDHIIDLGPEGGEGGGMLVASGTPEEVAANPKSHTGKFLKTVLENE
ncbi:MAG: excinuclease ABC subunit UvrA [Thermoplasmata archaeon HGW-Thermoplasmata-1]|nr:MAG: excinuclease ABC subunit UvrA [Thermoplasmata archaeon HGW-Thermoplasmata-1]